MVQFARSRLQRYIVVARVNSKHVFFFTFLVTKANAVGLCGSCWSYCLHHQRAHSSRSTPPNTARTHTARATPPTTARHVHARHSTARHVHEEGAPAVRDVVQPLNRLVTNDGRAVAPRVIAGAVTAPQQSRNKARRFSVGFSVEADFLILWASLSRPMAHARGKQTIVFASLD